MRQVVFVFTVILFAYCNATGRLVAIYADSDCYNSLPMPMTIFDPLVTCQPIPGQYFYYNYMLYYPFNAADLPPDYARIATSTLGCDNITALQGNLAAVDPQYFGQCFAWPENGTTYSMKMTGCDGGNGVLSYTSYVNSPNCDDSTSAWTISATCSDVSISGNTTVYGVSGCPKEFFVVGSTPISVPTSIPAGGNSPSVSYSPTALKGLAAVPVASLTVALLVGIAIS